MAFASLASFIDFSYLVPDSTVETEGYGPGGKASGNKKEIFLGKNPFPNTWK